eukprot:scaffold289420_cov24-Tisochrysis_lutea.AAC.1
MDSAPHVHLPAPQVRAACAAAVLGLEPQHHGRNAPHLPAGCDGNGTALRATAPAVPAAASAAAQQGRRRGAAPAAAATAGEA